MAKVDDYALEHLPFSSRLLGYLMGKLDANSVETIKQRTTLIDTVIREAGKFLTCSNVCSLSS